MAKISIIIPAYNVEDYLESTIDSVVGQTYRDIEILVVDDASSDRTREIILRYAENDARIVPVLFDDNKGPLYARKKGTELATGEYIVFVDGDDTLTVDACEIIATAIDEYHTDILQFPENVINVSDLNTDTISQVEKALTPYYGALDTDRLINKCAVDESISWNMHGKAFESKLMKKSCELMSDENISMAEDLYAHFVIMFFARTYRGVKSDGIYNYYIGRGITGQKRVDINTFRKYCLQGRIVELIQVFLQEQSAMDKFKRAFLNAKNRLLMHCVYNWKLLLPKHKREGFELLERSWESVDVISKLAEVCWYEKKETADGISVSGALKSTKDTVGTVAMFYYRLRNGGVERVVTRLIEIWTEMGLNVVLFTDEPPHADDYVTLSKYTRIVLPPGNDRKTFSKRAQALDNALTKYKIDVMVYHAWINEFALWDALIVKSCGIPFVMYTHNFFAFPALSSYLYQYDMPHIYRLFDYVVTLSRVDEWYWGNFCARVRCLSNPFHFELPQISVPIENNRELLWLGRLSPEKNFMDTIEIVALIAEKIPDIHLTIVGSGENEDVLEDFVAAIETRGLSDNISCVGFNKDVYQYYSKSAVFLLTSEYEGYSLTLLESKAYGLPCVAYDLPYLELFRDGEGLIVVPMRNTDAMAEEVISLLEDKEKYETLSKQARCSAERYSCIDYTPIWGDIFREACDTSDDFKTKNDRLGELTETNAIMWKSYLNNNETGIRKLNTDISNSFEHISSLYKRIKKLQDDIWEINQGVRKVTWENTSVRNELSALQDEAFILRNDASVLRDEASVLRNEASVLRNEASVLRGKNDKLSKEKKKVSAKFKRIKRSRSYRIGRAITFIPRKLLGSSAKKKSNGHRSNE
jgi:glycosyltransferase involved in cell wall biosynthesis